MFIIDRNKAALNLDQLTVQSVLQSLNQPMIATGNGPSEPTHAFVVIVADEQEQMNVHIYLHQVHSNQCVIYSDPEAPFTAEQVDCWR